MAKNSIVKLPNGITIEITPDFKPEQIQAIIQSVIGGTQIQQHPLPEEKIQRTASEVWQSSKREKVALFIRNYFSPSLWFSAKELLEEQLQIVQAIIFGETSQIGTYLNRLSEDGYLVRQNRGRLVRYRIQQKLIDDYPEVILEEMNHLLTTSL
ncbi:MAG: hypothetical protein INQ03_19595 [Candidatus Heimdallarchaeota archaeon]|nr:hypothetical protein [Candidatus Heimdallarchaeota archaeon]